MNIKKEKGITIIALIITVILMIILIGVSIHFGQDAMGKARMEDIKTDMISIKTKAKVIKEEYDFKDIDSLIGSQISNEEAAKIGVTNSNKVRKWSKADLEEEGLTTIEGDKYIVDYNNNCEVYYLDGYEGVYSLTDMQDM